jgi:hypothetical protein
MSDAGSCAGDPQQPTPVDLTFDDAAAQMPCLVSGDLPGGTYGPTNDPTVPGDCTSGPDAFSAPAPAGPYPVGLTTFNGVDPNGTWSLYTMDDQAVDTGAIDGGWSLDFTIPAGTLGSAPSISGKADVGKTLTAVSGTLGNGAVPGYQWGRCAASGSGCKPIPGATGASYKLVSADRAHSVTVTENAFTSGGSSAPLGSAPAVVGPATVSTSGTKKTQRVLKQKGLVVSLRSNIAGSLRASATVSVPGAAKTVRFKTAKRKLKAGKRVSVKLGLTSSARKEIAGVLGRGKKLGAKVTLTVTDASGARSTKRATVSLKR